jgi:hypothetical protein
MKNHRVLQATVALLLLLTVILGIASIQPAQPDKPDGNIEWASMRVCVADAIAKVNSPAATYDGMRQATDLCYAHLHQQALLNDFRIRRLKFTQQTYDERVLLWMVVVITLAGVGLAALQLVGSFRLASVGAANFDQQTELSVQQGKLSVKSSVTGLLILICSFAFFWVFVYEVFVIKTVDVDGGSSNANGMKQRPSQQISAGMVETTQAKPPAKRASASK